MGKGPEYTFLKRRYKMSKGIHITDYWGNAIRNWNEILPHTCRMAIIKRQKIDLEDSGGVRRGDHTPPHKYIRNTSTCGTTPTEHLLNTCRRPQTSEKATNSPRTWVG